MKIRYGNYTHADGEINPSLSRALSLNAAGEPYALLHRWTLRGTLLADSVAELTTAIRGLENAYSVNGRDLALLTDSGGSTAHLLKSSQCIGGVRVVDGPNFPTGDRGDYTTYRTYTITLEGEVILNGAEQLLAFSERVSFSGGGPRIVWHEALEGDPVPQVVAEKTVFRATQQGSTVGYLSYPNPPEPLFPGFLIENPEVQKESPKRTGRGARTTYTEFGISWNYQFASASPLNGNPTRWTG